MSRFEAVDWSTTRRVKSYTRYQSQFSLSYLIVLDFLGENYCDFEELEIKRTNVV